jgi:hypothetical protein
MYSAKIGELLTQHNFTIKNINELMIVMNYGKHQRIKRLQKLGELSEDILKNGTTFTLPSLRRDGAEFLFHADLSENDIIRLLNLKAFL